MGAQLFSCIRLFATLWTVAHLAPLFVGFSRQKYWSGLPFPPPGDLPNTGVKPRFPTLHVDSLPSEPPGKPTESPGEPQRKDRFSSVTQSCPTLCDPIDCSMPGLPRHSVVNNLPVNAGDVGSIPVLGRSPGGGNGNML